MVGDVFREHVQRLGVANDPFNVRPQVASVVDARAVAGGAEWLARVARCDDIHDATPWDSVERGNVRPDRRRIQGAVAHARNQDRGGVGFPFHETDRSYAGGRERNPEFETSDPGT